MIGNITDKFLNFFVLGVIAGVLYLSSSYTGLAAFAETVYDSPVWFPTAAFVFFTVVVIVSFSLSERR